MTGDSLLHLIHVDLQSCGHHMCVLAGCLVGSIQGPLQSCEYVKCALVVCLQIWQYCRGSQQICRVPLQATWPFLPHAAATCAAWQSGHDTSSQLWPAEGYLISCSLMAMLNASRRSWLGSAFLIYWLPGNDHQLSAGPPVSSSSSCLMLPWGAT